MANYTIIRNILNTSFTPLVDMGLEGKKILSVWTILDEKMMFEGPKFDTETGEKIENPTKRTLENPLLLHNRTAFLEDRLHDWDLYGNRFKIYSRLVDKDVPLDLIIEHT